MTTIIPASSPLAGRVLGGTYRIMERIDEGGMGTVYAAEHTRLHRTVAVKVIARHLKSNPGALARFKREAEIVSQIHHPHVVQILDFDSTEEGQPYLVMEMLQGLSLEKALAQDRVLPWPVALRIAVQCAWALSAAHGVGVVHRDLKPANIFLVEAGEPHFVKLLDFGIGKRTEESASTRHLTGEFDILGTPDYMSPEQASGSTARVDHRGDQYSLAVILFEMVTGHVPFSAPDVMRLLQKVISEVPPIASSYNSLIPARLDRILERALNKEPHERFDSVAQFAQSLEGVLEHAPRVSLVPPRFAYASILPRPNPASPEPPPFESLPHAPASLDLPPSDRPLLEPKPRTSWRAQNPVLAVRELIDRARQELGLDNLEVALSCAESAIEVAQDMSEYPEAGEAVRQNARLFSRIFERKLGSLGKRVKVLVPASQAGTLRPEQAFLLSRFEGGFNLEEVIDLSPLSRELTLAHIVSLVRAGRIQVVP